MAKLFPLQCDGPADDPHTKAHLLYQAHFSRFTALNSEFQTDQKSVLDQGIRILQVSELSNYLFFIPCNNAANFLGYVGRMRGRWLAPSVDRNYEFTANGRSRKVDHGPSIIDLASFGSGVRASFGVRLLFLSRIFWWT